MIDIFEANPRCTLASYNVGNSVVAVMTQVQHSRCMIRTAQTASDEGFLDPATSSAPSLESSTSADCLRHVFGGSHIGHILHSAVMRWCSSGDEVCTVYFQLGEAQERMVLLPDANNLSDNSSGGIVVSRAWFDEMAAQCWNEIESRALAAVAPLPSGAEFVERLKLHSCLSLAAVHSGERLPLLLQLDSIRGNLQNGALIIAPSVGDGVAFDPALVSCPISSPSDVGDLVLLVGRADILGAVRDSILAATVPPEIIMMSVGSPTIGCVVAMAVVPAVPVARGAAAADGAMAVSETSSSAALHVEPGLNFLVVENLWRRLGGSSKVAFAAKGVSHVPGVIAIIYAAVALRGYGGGGFAIAAFITGYPERYLQLLWDSVLSGDASVHADAQLLARRAIAAHAGRVGEKPPLPWDSARSQNAPLAGRDTSQVVAQGANLEVDAGQTLGGCLFWLRPETQLACLLPFAGPSTPDTLDRLAALAALGSSISLAEASAMRLFHLFTPATFAKRTRLATVEGIGILATATRVAATRISQLQDMSLSTTLFVPFSGVVGCREIVAHALGLPLIVPVDAMDVITGTVRQRTDFGGCHCATRPPLRNIPIYHAMQTTHCLELFRLS